MVALPVDCCLFVCLLAYLFVCPFGCLFVCLFVCLLVYLFVCLFVSDNQTQAPGQNLRFLIRLLIHKRN